MAFVLSHISRKPSEMWGTRPSWQVRRVIVGVLAMASAA
jgi:hypothetical protein